MTQDFTFAEHLLVVLISFNQNHFHVFKKNP